MKMSAFIYYLARVWTESSSYWDQIEVLPLATVESKGSPVYVNYYTPSQVLIFQFVRKLWFSVESCIQSIWGE